MKRILIIDDQETELRANEMLLSEEGFSVSSATNYLDALEVIESAPGSFDLILIDYDLGDTTGTEVAKKFLKINSDLNIIIFSGFDSREVLTDSLKAGAITLIPKTIGPVKFLEIINNFLNNKISSATELDIPDADKELKKLGIIGVSKEIKDIGTKINTICTNNKKDKILILGENGSGKELIARAIHAATYPNGAPFVGFNINALQPTLIEAELFGSVRGSFTGSIKDTQGKFSLAQNGTIFLDEIGDLEMSLQKKLLRVLQENEFTPVGATKAIKFKGRIVSATNVNLKEQVLSGKFREDLYHRLNVLSISVPPLKERRDDIPILVNYFLNSFQKNKQSKKTISTRCMEALCRYNWPGNVRELRNEIVKLATLTKGNTINPSDLEPQFIENDLDLAGQISYEDFEKKQLNQEKEFLDKAMFKCNWNISKASKELGISRTSLVYRLEKIGIMRSSR